MPKTREIIVLQGNYGYGWEDMIEYDNYEEARQDLIAYMENEPQYSHKLVKRRTPIDE